MAPPLDDVDRGILHALQVDARNSTAREIAEQTGVSASTVRNRIAELEADGVIRGYHPEIDYETAGLPLRVLFVVSAPPSERSAAVRSLMEIDGIVTVRELLTGRRNVHVEVVGTSTGDVTRITDAIHDLGVEIERSEIVARRRIEPFGHFREEGRIVEDGGEEE